jgi:hypothetical protein
MPQGVTSGLAPRVEKISAVVQPVAAAVDLNTDIGEVPADGDTWTVTSVSYTPKADITGATVEYRTFSLVNTGVDGNGTTVVATLPFSATTVTALDDDEKAITLSATAANLIVAAGAILQWQSVHSGSTGLADPGGLVQVELDRD